MAFTAAWPVSTAHRGLCENLPLVGRGLFLRKAFPNNNLERTGKKGISLVEISPTGHADCYTSKSAVGRHLGGGGMKARWASVFDPSQLSGIEPGHPHPLLFSTPGLDCRQSAAAP